MLLTLAVGLILFPNVITLGHRAPFCAIWCAIGPYQIHYCIAISNRCNSLRNFTRKILTDSIILRPPVVAVLLKIGIVPSTSIFSCSTVFTYLLLQNISDRYNQANSSISVICGTPYTNQLPKFITLGPSGKHLT